MSLTRAEKDFISLLKNEGVKEEPAQDFSVKLLQAVVSGTQPENEEERIRWGSAALTNKFKNYDDKRQKNTWVKQLTPDTIARLCAALLDQRNTFEQGPLRQVHVISKLYGELLEQAVASNAFSKQTLPDYLHELNIKMLRQYILLDPSHHLDAAIGAFRNCMNNFLFMYCQANATPGMVNTMRENESMLHKLYEDDIDRIVAENKDELRKHAEELIEERKLKEIAREFINKKTDSLHSATPILRRKQEKSLPQDAAAEQQQAVNIDPQHKRKKAMMMVHRTMSNATLPAKAPPAQAPDQDKTAGSSMTEALRKHGLHSDKTPPDKAHSADGRLEDNDALNNSQKLSKKDSFNK